MPCANASISAFSAVDRANEASVWINNWRKKTAPSHVRDAEEWITAWREKQQEVVPSTSEAVPAHVADADRWIAAWRTKQIPSHVTEAEQWIAAWRAKLVPAHVADADQWIAAWRHSQRTRRPIVHHKCKLICHYVNIVNVDRFLAMT